MSHLWDCMGQFSGESQDYSSLTDFQADMSNFDLPLSENDPTYMSSDFFSCVDWVENTFGDDIPSNNLCPISNVQSPHSSESIDSLTLGSDATGSVTTDENINVNQVLSLENFEVTPKPEPIVNNKQRNQTTKVVLQSNPKRVVVTKPINVGNKINNKPKQQVIRVQALNGNGSSVLLPVNVKNVKKFKIINAGDLNMENIKVTAPVNAFIKKSQITEKIMESTDEDEQEEKQHDSRYPPLNLTSEEKRLLLKEGIKLPSHYPLTKNEEKELKRIRRKIRNKISAQDSRKRKKEYVDKLEEKAKRTSEENEFLKKRIKLLRKQNGKLVEQMRRINALLQSTTSSKATPATCLMIVLFSTLLVCLPSLRLSDKQELGQQKLFAARRALLFNQKANEDDVNMDEFLVFNKEDESEIDNFVEEESENTTNEMTGVQMLMQIAKRLNDISNDKNCSDPNNNSAEEFCNRFKDQAINIYYNLKPHLEGSKPPEKGFIEPDISDDEDTGVNRSGFKEEPPSKRRKLDVSDVIYQEKPSDQDLLLNYMNRKQE